MQAVAALSRPWSESRTSSMRELLPPKSYVQEMWPWPAGTWPAPSSSSLLMKPSQALQRIETSVFREVESVMRWLVEEQVRLHDARRVQDYIVEFPDLIEVVPEAVRAAKKHLPEAQLILEVYRDPEIEDRYLALYVRLPRYDEKVMERIEAAESEFLYRLADAEGWLQLTTDFGKPEVG